MRIELFKIFLTETEMANLASMSRGKSESKDPKRLIEQEYERGHYSINRNNYLIFRCWDIPLYVLRQWNRHEVGQNKEPLLNDEGMEFMRLAESGYNEKSMRYTKNPKLELPHRLLDYVDPQKLVDINDQLLKLYTDIIQKKGPAEVARMVLPMTMLTSFIWTVSVETLLKFFKERLADAAQLEIKEVALEIFLLTQKELPWTMRKFLDTKDQKRFKWFNQEIKYIEHAV